MNLIDMALSALSAPGDYTRGLLTGRPGERVDSYGLLEALGAAPNQPGLDWGDAAAFGADVLTDPFTFLGGGALKGAKALGKAAKFDDLFKPIATQGLPPHLTGGFGAMDDIAAGFPAGNFDIPALGYTPRPMLEGRRLFPDDALANTLAKDEFGNPIKLFHGSPAGPVLEPDPSRWSIAGSDRLLFGPGHYMTANPEIASSYAAKDDVLRSGTNPAVTSYFLDSRKPLDLTGPLPPVDVTNIYKEATADGMRIYDPFLEDAYKKARQGIPLNDPETFYMKMADEVGHKHAMNDLLQNLGYDAIRHTGGTRVGGGKSLHDVWIALNEVGVYEPFLESQVKGKWM